MDNMDMDNTKQNASDTLAMRTALLSELKITLDAKKTEVEKLEE